MSLVFIAEGRLRAYMDGQAEVDVTVQISDIVGAGES
jgi:hypothetical protein